MKQRKNMLAMSFVLLFLGGAATDSLGAEREKDEYSGGPAGAASYGVPQIPKIPRVPQTSSYIPTPVKPSVLEIQKELEEIVQIHRSLQAQHRAQVAEIQRITEQAKAHQKLLQNLSPAPGGEEAPAEDMDEAVRRQKILLIKEQARENREAHEEIKKKEAEEGAEEQAAEPDAKAAGAPSPAPGPPQKKKTFWW